MTKEEQDVYKRQTLSPDLLDEVLSTVEQSFDLSVCKEYTCLLYTSFSWD